MKRLKMNLAAMSLVVAVAASAFGTSKFPKAIGDYFGVTSMSGSAYVLTSVRNTCLLRDPSIHCISTSSNACLVKQLVSSPTNPDGYFKIEIGGFYVP